MARTAPALSGAVEEFERAALKRGLKINEEKTMNMKTSRRSTACKPSFNMLNYAFPVCKEFKYLGTIVTKDNYVTSEIKGRMAAGNRCFWAVQREMRFRCLSRLAKLVIYRTIIRPVVTYGSETWVLTAANERLLNCWERKVLRKIFGAICENGTWRIRTNAELRRLYGEPDIVAFIKRGRCRWLGHVERMPAERYPKKALNGAPGGRRLRGRPRRRWLEDVEDDLTALGVRRWRLLAQDRKEWSSIAERALVLVGP
uniref:Uncharacterized transposon-derived protein F52C9.6 n=1 Tax=Lygus hesperus TaxID=30085 RepID=A0A146MAV6_LYGHE